jgi:ABC-type multidrug transport system ATPase subunit
MGVLSGGSIKVGHIHNARKHPSYFMILQADQLCFAYPQCAALFTGLSFQLQPGVSLVRGGDARGKTTLLRILAGDMATDSGRLRIHGVDLHGVPAAYRQQVFWMEPRSTAFDQITPSAYFESLRGIYAGWNAAALGTLTEGLSLTEHLDKPMYMLSTGSKRKVWLAAAFASKAALVLLDDPFAALDKPSIAFVMQQLRQMTQQQEQACVVAHYAIPADAQGPLALADTVDLGD